MLEAILILAYAAVAAWIAIRAYRNPHGVYLRSLVGFLLCVVAAAGIWLLASPWISNAGGLGAFFLFVAVCALGAVIAILACAAATARFVRDSIAG